MNTNIEVLRELDELVEAARLLGVTQAKKGFGCHTDEDSRFERAMYESIDKHRAALLDLEAKQPAPQQPAAVDAGRAQRIQALVDGVEVDLEAPLSAGANATTQTHGAMLRQLEPQLQEQLAESENAAAAQAAEIEALRATSPLRD